MILTAYGSSTPSSRNLRLKFLSLQLSSCHHQSELRVQKQTIIPALHRPRGIDHANIIPAHQLHQRLLQFQQRNILAQTTPFPRRKSQFPVPIHASQGLRVCVQPAFRTKHLCVGPERLGRAHHSPGTIRDPGAPWNEAPVGQRVTTGRDLLLKIPGGWRP